MIARLLVPRDNMTKQSATIPTVSAALKGD